MKYGLEPVIDHVSRILILGTLPGDESLRLGQYYSNPRNQFWRILAMSYNTSISEPYEDRIEFLKSRGLALHGPCLDPFCRALDNLPNDGLQLVTYLRIRMDTGFDEHDRLCSRRIAVRQFIFQPSGPGGEPWPASEAWV